MFVGFNIFIDFLNRALCISLCRIVIIAIKFPKMSICYVQRLTIANSECKISA